MRGDQVRVAFVSFVLALARIPKGAVGALPAMIIDPGDSLTKRSGKNVRAAGTTGL